MYVLERKLFKVTLSNGVVVHVVADTIGDIDAIADKKGWRSVTMIESKGIVYVKEG